MKTIKKAQSKGGKYRLELKTDGTEYRLEDYVNRELKGVSRRYSKEQALILFEDRVKDRKEIDNINLIIK